MDRYCTECGQKIEDGSEFCSNCGTKILDEEETTKTYEPQVVVKNEKNPGLAAVLSFLIIGLGQIYNGEIAKGLILLIVSYICIALFFLIIPPIIGVVLWIYAIYDAYNTAKGINEGTINAN
ncbi:zinc-ribbon domain-containing protein [Methanobrevibacter sp. TMH8]|uniref:zinc-ribbon domain-containing protein n=1 Tax=Methanobrevibacter sp. TMH8 TaxID=2848611 RepID=UPI001CCD751F|nr:zinc-ribbon domain-containing protein [Methanobrevibacter sp. TMH8]MBZ9570909.1 zinc-ribbon domain-containing protein [Methanobrevibacter sp. TMH8]